MKWLLLYLGMSVLTAFGLMLWSVIYDEGERKKLTSYKATVSWVFSKDGGVCAAVGAFWPLALTALMIYGIGNIPAIIIWLAIRRKVLAAQGITKLNQRSAA